MIWLHRVITPSIRSLTFSMSLSLLFCTSSSHFGYKYAQILSTFMPLTLSICEWFSIPSILLNSSTPLPGCSTGTSISICPKLYLLRWCSCYWYLRMISIQYSPIYSSQKPRNDSPLLQHPHSPFSYTPQNPCTK